MPGINDTYFAQRLRISDRPDLFLFFGRHILQGQFRNQSEASFHIYNPHQRFEGITFELERQILMLARRHFTKVDDLITETVAISQHPNVRGNDIFMPDFFFLQQFAIRMCIYQHLFVEYGTLDNFFVVVRGNE